MSNIIKDLKKITFPICLVISAYTLFTEPYQWVSLAATLGWLAATCEII